MMEVLDAACDALGFGAKGLSAKEKAEACWKNIHGLREREERVQIRCDCA